MYAEFIWIYVLLGILAVLLLAAIVLLCVVLKKVSQAGPRNSGASSFSYSGGSAYSSHGTVVCRNCATQFNSALSVCPRCGTPR